MYCTDAQGRRQKKQGKRPYPLQKPRKICKRWKTAPTAQPVVSLNNSKILKFSTTFKIFLMVLKLNNKLFKIHANFVQIFLKTQLQ